MTKDVYVWLKGIINTVNKAVERVRELSSKDYMKAIEFMTGDLYSAVSAVNLQLLDDVSVDTGNEIEVVSLDDDLMEKVTLIKMDIEGAEQAALSGCRRHIKEEMPKLLISVYHNNEDIWKIPRMVEEMNSNYRFYLRSNGRQWGPAEIVFFAL